MKHSWSRLAFLKRLNLFLELKKKKSPASNSDKVGKVRWVCGVYVFNKPWRLFLIIP